MESPRDDSPVAAGTIFESFDGWAQLLKNHAASVDSLPAAAPAPPRTIPTEAEARPWRPGRRLPMALLHVVDDGRDTGETIRLRDDTLAIGRITGAVSIPHDPSLADHHARLDRLPGGGWLLSDLGSADGTWVRVMTAKLRPGTRLQVGGTRLVFRRGHDGAAEFVPVDQHAAPLPCPAPPFLVGRSDAAATLEAHGLPSILLDDPFVSPIHAEVITSRTSWRIVNRGLNGLWVRIESPVRLGGVAQVQCGDQRFVLEPLAEDD
jgi:pSer/pThr/pTyr-binding forkhead associated (FHA) protein